jgi:hypothetical protein
VLRAFRSDDRLVKTLLLAALAPDVEALRDLTARRLAALNHGTITALIPGQEVGEVVCRLRSWASRVAELQSGEGSDPSVRLNLVGVNGTKVLVPDVRIGDWQRPWNAKSGKKVADAPESHYWASDERGFGQVGCVYTAQGFEYDWAGVIFGPDFVRREDRWVARREHSHDPAVKKAEDANFHELIRNTYRVLLTRGMRGVLEKMAR